MPGSAGADHKDVVDRCAQCLTAVSRQVVYRTPDGETLCADCYLALWGLPEGNRGRTAQRLAAPQHRRRRRSVWMSEPTDELTLEQRVRRVLRSQRPEG
jgi:hypothetical protein